MKFKRKGSLLSFNMFATYAFLSCIYFSILFLDIDVDKINPYNIFYISVIIFFLTSLKIEYFSCYYLKEKELWFENKYIPYDEISKVQIVNKHIVMVLSENGEYSMFCSVEDAEDFSSEIKKRIKKGG